MVVEYNPVLGSFYKYNTIIEDHIMEYPYRTELSWKHISSQAVESIDNQINLMQSQNKTDGILIKKGPISIRNWASREDAQIWVDFCKTLPELVIETCEILEN